MKPAHYLSLGVPLLFVHLPHPHRCGTDGAKLFAPQPTLVSNRTLTLLQHLEIQTSWGKEVSSPALHNQVLRQVTPPRIDIFQAKHSDFSSA